VVGGQDEADSSTDLVRVSGLLMLFRFGLPALIFGATGPGPFGNSWLAQGTTAMLLLDADLRFFGAMLLGLGVFFFWTILRVEALGSVILYWPVP
jgi:hypothetical protein